MPKSLRSFVLFLLIAGCVEPYEFMVRDTAPSLVVEASISDKSFNETLTYPSDGRYFTVRLTMTGDVTNVRPQPVTGATVELQSSDGETWFYQAVELGVYALLNDEFEARKGIDYKLRIVLQDENIYESSWERMPETEIPPIGEIDFVEGEKQVYVMESSEWVLRTKQIISTYIQIPENETGETIRYRYAYSPMWIYVAPLVSRFDPVSKCWATDANYLNSYGLQLDNKGGYKKDLFELFTVRNERIFEKLSVLVTQHAMREPYYNFWKEMKDQNEGSALADTPPYSLKTNFHSPTGGKKASGYFGVTAEQATRWYFDRTDLSYDMPNTMLDDCLVVYGPGGPAPECLDCREYSFGKATTTMPSWWQQ